MTEPSNKTKHESYGSITFTHRHSHPRHTFGSPVEHADLVHIQIQTATLLRSLSEDHIMSDQHIFSGYMSPAQFAQALFTMNNGPATPITIEYVTGDTKRRQQTPPPKDTPEQFENEVQSLLDGILAECDQLANTTKGAIRKQALSIKHSLENNIPFIQQRMKENLHHVADQAKRDFDAYRERTIRQAGLEALNALHQRESSSPDHNIIEPASTPNDRHITTRRSILGGLSAMSSINRVIEAHGDEIQEEWAQHVPSFIAPQFKQVILENATYSLRICWQFQDGETLPGPQIDIDELAERYPDCEVGY